MKRVNAVLENELFRRALAKIEEGEEGRVFCRHGLPHLLDTARIMRILALKEGKALPQEEIYACALLHDIGRESGAEHASKSAALAEKILPQCGFDEKESARICEAIAEHGHDKEGNSALAELLCRADRLSRPCFACAAAGDCYWIKKNAEIDI